MSMFAGMRIEFARPPVAEVPSDLPAPESLLVFDIHEKKNQVFEAARERIKSKAQYTKSVSTYDIT